MSWPRYTMRTWMTWRQLLTCCKADETSGHQCCTHCWHLEGSNSSLAPAINSFSNMLAKPKFSCLYSCCLWEGACVGRGVPKPVTNTPVPGWAPPAFLCLLSWDFKHCKHGTFSTEGAEHGVSSISDNIYTHSHVHTYIRGLTLPLNFREAQVPSVSNLLNKLFQNCQVGYFSPLSLSQNYFVWENELYRKLSVFLYLTQGKKLKFSYFLLN